MRHRQTDCGDGCSQSHSKPWLPPQGAGEVVPLPNLGKPGNVCKESNEGRLRCGNPYIARSPNEDSPGDFNHRHIDTGIIQKRLCDAVRSSVAGAKLLFALSQIDIGMVAYRI